MYSRCTFWVWAVPRGYPVLGPHRRWKFPSPRWQSSPFWLARCFRAWSWSEPIWCPLPSFWHPYRASSSPSSWPGRAPSGCPSRLQKWRGAWGYAFALGRPSPMEARWIGVEPQLRPAYPGGSFCTSRFSKVRTAQSPGWRASGRSWLRPAWS